MIISTWNVRGLNQPLKQKELKLFLQKHKIDPLGCLETRVKQFKSQTILNKVAHGWNSKCNYLEAVNGRIWLLWRSTTQVKILETNEQFMQCYVENQSGSLKAYVTIVYARNTATERTPLWSALVRMGATITDPWVLSGDINSVLSSFDRLGSDIC
ncbi:hypothetical protein MTR67_001867 [Solanum verrucosum]|uniref:Endonuclease/exonuclease/phosphatase domain-containing protein n=1 Tax=Solanum verrucosum TaxID=315347 RepID=A0AAF0T5D9_SOLVR|nr:hypothetical protein MTR67_001867 [Solanum verrucosum]